MTVDWGSAEGHFDLDELWPDEAALGQQLREYYRFDPPQDMMLRHLSDLRQQMSELHGSANGVEVDLRSALGNTSEYFPGEDDTIVPIVADKGSDRRRVGPLLVAAAALLIIVSSLGFGASLGRTEAISEPASGSAPVMQSRPARPGQAEGDASSPTVRSQSADVTTVDGGRTVFAAPEQLENDTGSETGPSPTTGRTTSPSTASTSVPPNTARPTTSSPAQATAPPSASPATTSRATTALPPTTAPPTTEAPSSAPPTTATPTTSPPTTAPPTTSPPTTAPPTSAPPTTAAPTTSPPTTAPPTTTTPPTTAEPSLICLLLPLICGLG